jgi:hypothetical protein
MIKIVNTPGETGWTNLMDSRPVAISPEVQLQIGQKKSQIRVIISVQEEFSVQDLLKRLEELPQLDLGTVSNTDHYVFASLTTEQIQKLATYQEVANIWSDQPVIHMVMDSLLTINATEFCVDQKTLCSDICWAILDTGIDATHEALANSKIIDRDLTGEGPSGAHGTMVAGILAGWDPARPFFGVAPQCQLYNFKVLKDKDARDNWISTTIKAMAEIREINEAAGKFVIHGANISLGVDNEYNLKQYKAGHSPICEEADRLVESGVVVCIAAGNFGAQAFDVPGNGGQAAIWANFEMITISDPGNAELPITVGSVHKKYPHKYGVSYFSSKGPTGDGRQKPDLVAPGEDILTTAPGNQYVVSSGTSLAAPFVSGTAVQMLHAHPELIGKPDLVKRILMMTCRDLKRDRSFQGRGLVDLASALRCSDE